MVIWLRDLPTLNCEFCVNCNLNILGSGGGSVGRVVATNTTGLRFESSHWQKFILNIYCQLY